MCDTSLTIRGERERLSEFLVEIGLDREALAAARAENGTARREPSVGQTRPPQSTFPGLCFLVLRRNLYVSTTDRWLSSRSPVAWSIRGAMAYGLNRRFADCPACGHPKAAHFAGRCYCGCRGRGSDSPATPPERRTRPESKPQSTIGGPAHRLCPYVSVSGGDETSSDLARRRPRLADECPTRRTRPRLPTPTGLRRLPSGATRGVPGGT